VTRPLETLDTLYPSESLSLSLGALSRSFSQLGEWVGSAYFTKPQFQRDFMRSMIQRSRSHMTTELMRGTFSCASGERCITSSVVHADLRSRPEEANVVLLGEKHSPSTWLKCAFHMVS
jgi:hypothetical protein